jgi:hypothetical protein
MQGHAPHVPGDGVERELRMPVKFEVQVIDSGWSLVDDLEGLDDVEIQAGVLEGADAHEDIETATLALIHEDGAPKAHIPARPFMAPTFDANVVVYGDQVEIMVDRTVAGQMTDGELVDLADKIADDQRQSIIQRKHGVPLRPSTLAQPLASLRKLGDTPLVDTGALLESLNGQVVKGGVRRA